MSQPLKACPACSGRGVVPRQLRMIGEGAERKPDPLDFQREELCVCGGGGKVPDLPKDAPKPEPRRPGFVADQIAIQADWLAKAPDAPLVPLADETEAAAYC